MVDCACIATVVSPVLQVAEWLAAPIWRSFKYLYNYTTNFKNLEMEVGKLKNTRDDVEREIIAAERNVEVINQNVKDWQKNVEETITKAEQLIQGKANNPRCFKGLRSNFIIHYKQSRKAFKLKRDDIDPLLQQKLDPISYKTDPPEIWLESGENYLDFETRNSTVKKVWEALNDENVFMIGVYGMGGLGKTTLVEEIGRKADRKAEKDKLFDDIVFVEVSKSPDVKKIQTTIARKLGLKFENENESEMANKLYSRMKGKNILLILDNIWEPLDLERTIGIPCGANRGGNKLLFTTRNEDVLKSMHSTDNFWMGFLNEDEAWALFTKMIGNDIQTRELCSLAKDICRECNGLPIIICAIAKTLKNMSSKSGWRVVLKDLKEPSPTEYSRFLEAEYKNIALSYEYLKDDELKKIFLISSLMENNASISDLLRHVLCLNILKGVNLTMEDARDRLDEFICELKDACLLLNGFTSGQFAMHDVIRDVAITIAYVHHHVLTTRNDIERDWKERDKLKKCTKIFLPNGNTIIGQLRPNDWDCPNLEYFSMSCTWNSSFKIPNELFRKMPKLKVLNLVGLKQSSLPSSIDFLANLQTLCLDYSNVEDFAIIGRLNKLKILSLRFSNIKEFPTDMGHLTQLRLLDLSHCSQLKVVAPNVLSSLSQLEELYLMRCSIQWKIEVFKELKLLSKLTSLELDIKDDKVLPKDFFSREFIRYKISVGNWQYRYQKIYGQEWLRILELIINPTINLEELDGIKNVENLCLAEYLDDKGKDDLERSKFFLQSNGVTPLFNKKVIFPYLKVLMLKNIISRKIWNSQLPSSFFENLTELTLWRCTKIKFVFPYAITKNLQQLQYLEIKDCIDLEEIVAIEEITEAAASFVFLEVTFLELENLPKLATFYPGIHTLEWPKLEKLAVKDCDKFNMFNSEPNSLCLDQKVILPNLKVLELKSSLGEIWNKESSTYSYENLTHLTLCRCDKIKYVFPLSIAKSLQQLQYLELTSCKVLERIVAPEEGREATINFFFPQVSTVKLQYLPEFADFYPEIHTSEWPKLKELVVNDCGKFKMLTSEPNFLCFDQKINHDLEDFQLRNGLDHISWRSQSKELEIVSFESAHTSLWLLQRFENLTCLSVFNCNELVNLTTPSTARNLVQLRELEISYCKMLMEILEIEEDATIEIVFENLNKLSFNQMENLTCFCSGNYTFNFRSLEELNIAECPNIKTFCRGILSTPKLQKISYEEMEVEIEGNDLNKTIQELYKKEKQDISLDLNLKCKAFHHDNSIEIVYNQHPSSFYQNLTHLLLWKCGNIKYAFPSSIAKSLHQLQQLKIQNCKALEEIVAKEDGANAVVNFVFPNVTLLKFEDLPELTTFYPGLYALEMPKLKELAIEDCTKYASLKENNVGTELNILAPKSVFSDNKVHLRDLEVLKLKNISFEKIWDSQLPTSSYQNLTHLTLCECDKIKYVFPLSIAKSLQQLQYFELTSCKVLERIVAPEEGTEATVNFFFSQVSTVKLYNLPEFIGIHISEWLKLKELMVKDCPKFKMFTSEPNSLCLDQKVSFSGVAHTPNVCSQHDLTKAVVRTLNQGSNVISMDFHPQQQTILLVGTNVGDISIWEVGSQERLAHKSFKIWDISVVSMPFKAALVKDPVMSVNQCVWGPDGLMLGVAFSKHIVHIYTYDPTGELRQHLEIDAHVGRVNDIAFAYPNKQLCIVTCGDDKTIKVWDAIARCKQFAFEGHEAPVYSVCPYHKENIQFLFSTAIDGKIKAWLYDGMGPRVDYDAPGHWCTMVAYSADGTRLFSCGTSKQGESFLVEWNESEGSIKRTYSGFKKLSLGVVQFDTTQNRFLAAGDEFQIKFWDMDNTDMLTAVDADGGLPASPRLRFNKEGSLLAVTTSGNGIKILANSDGLRLIRMLENAGLSTKIGSHLNPSMVC